jgi:hypothetical protein
MKLPSVPLSLSRAGRPGEVRTADAGITLPLISANLLLNNNR